MGDERERSSEKKRREGKIEQKGRGNPGGKGYAVKRRKTF